MHMCVLLTYVYECMPKGYACVCFEKPTDLDEMHRNLLQKVVLPMNILLTFSMYIQDWWPSILQLQHKYKYSCSHRDEVEKNIIGKISSIDIHFGPQNIKMTIG